MNTRKTIVNFPFPVICTPYSEELEKEMTEYLNAYRVYEQFAKNISWHLAYDFHLYREDAIKFVAAWRRAL
jgi:hypothetical protein